MKDSQRISRPHTNFYLGISCCLLALSALPSPVSSQELGRLFFTPERRQMLDRQRQLNLQERQEAPEASTLTINGVVTRSSGKRTVWINGVTQNEKDIGKGVAATPNTANPGKIFVQPESGAAATAGIGDTLNRTTGEATELLQGGRIVIHRPNPAR